MISSEVGGFSTYSLIEYYSASSFITSQCYIAHNGSTDSLIKRVTNYMHALMVIVFRS